MTAQKQDKTYSKIIHWIRCKLSYSLLRSAIMCLRGARSRIHHPVVSTDTMDLACQEGRVPLNWPWTSISFNTNINCFLLTCIHAHLLKSSKKRKKKKEATSPRAYCDSYSHLGILRLVSASGSTRISNRGSAGRSAFFALNSVGARFGCLHPITSYKLYASQLCSMGQNFGPSLKLTSPC